MSKYYSVEHKKIKSTGRDIKLIIIKPKKNKKSKEKTPGILWMHGGGLLKGSAKRIFISRAINLVKKHGAVVISPDYRLSTEAPYPAALDDCYAALKYLKEHATELEFNDSQIMVGGESAGGGLTATLCMYARDKKEISIAYQMPLYPMLDCEDTASSKDNHSLVWNTKKNHKAWKSYLGDLKEVPAYASAARQTDYSNLPPAYTFVSDKDPLYDETVKYIENLRKAGIKAEIDIYPNSPHAFDILEPFAKNSKHAKENFEKNYLYAVEHYFKDQK